MKLMFVMAYCFICINEYKQKYIIANYISTHIYIYIHIPIYIHTHIQLYNNIYIYA